MASTQRIREVLAPIYREAFGGDAARRLDVDVAPDHDGEESLFLRAHIDPRDSDKLYGDHYLAFFERVMGALTAIDESRFPYIRFEFGEISKDFESEIVRRMMRSQ